jgi:hypothetical protein
MKTRGRPSTKAAKETTEAPVSSEPKTQLGPEVANPPQLFVLPDNVSKDARIVSLENPRSSSKSRYFVCPERGFYEFTKVAAPRTTPRSWLLSSDDLRTVDNGDNGGEDSKDKFSSSGYVMRNASLFVATPMDPLFFVLPALAPVSASKGSEPSKKLFLSREDYLEKVTDASPDLKTLLREEALRTKIEKRMASICDMVNAGDETMYRLSEEKMLKELLKKAKRMSEKGLPASMEEKFIRKALEVPMMSVKREENSLNEDETPAETPDTQSTTTSTDTAASSFSEASTAATSFSGDAQDATPQVKTPSIPPIKAPEGVLDLLRLRTALFFICSNYIPPHLTEIIKKSIASPNSTVDFAPLEAHLAHLADLRQKALAARQLGGFSQKRSLEEDEDGESRAEKKRKVEEEEKRKKAGESRGVKNLKKVNVSGMKKMSDFFKKK